MQPVSKDINFLCLSESLLDTFILFDTYYYPIVC